MDFRFTFGLVWIETPTSTLEISLHDWVQHWVSYEVLIECLSRCLRELSVLKEEAENSHDIILFVCLMGQ